MMVDNTPEAFYRFIGEDPRVAWGELAVWRDYGLKVGARYKGKFLNKFGRSEEVTTASRTVALLGAGESHETYLDSNAITLVSSDGTGDEQTIVVEGHTIDGSGDFTFVTQAATLTGQDPVTLDTPLARCSRLYNTGTEDFAGNIYVYEDETPTAGVPQTPEGVHLVVPLGKNQSFKAATTISKDDFYFITQLYASVNKKTSAIVDVELEIRLKGSVFRQQFPISVATAGSNTAVIDFNPVIIVPRNADIRMTAIANTGSGIGVSGGFNGYLASVLG